MRKKASSKMASSSDEVSCEIGMEEEFKNSENLRIAKLDIPLTMIRKHCNDRRRNRTGEWTSNSHDGKLCC